ncbi:MAG: hypothetical protein KF803_11450 [Cyclobacteriaceae bacterium]|nr:hypothetical protein [Cyclobacteriaceae bacterium]
MESKTTANTGFVYIRVGGQIRWIYPPLNKPNTLGTIIYKIVWSHGQQ